MDVCPVCGGDLIFVVVGSDPYFGEVKELACRNCTWSESSGDFDDIDSGEVLEERQ